MGLLELFGLELQVLLVSTETFNVIFFLAFDDLGEWEAFDSIQLQGKVAFGYELIPSLFASPQGANLKIIHFQTIDISYE